MTDLGRSQPGEAAAVESPCVDICVMNEETGYCEGCGRTIDEIAEWSSYSPAQRRRIIAELGRRLSPPPAS